MVISFFIFSFFIMIVGMALGALLGLKIWYVFPHFSVFVGLICFSSLVVGAISGVTIFDWLPLVVIRIIIIFICIGIVIYFYHLYHPSYGYIPYRGFVHWSILLFLFFFIGIDFAIIGFSLWLFIILLPIFLVSLFIGTFFIWKGKGSRMMGRFIVFLPLLLFLFIGLVKLI